jgi:hypothetical protein
MSSQISALIQRQAQLHAEENFDWATCLLACRDKWLESCQLGSILSHARAARQPIVPFKLYFLQSRQESNTAIGLFEVLKKDTLNEVAISTYCPDRLDTGELLKEPAPWDIIHPAANIRSKALFKGDTEFFHGGKPRRERPANSHY